MEKEPRQREIKGYGYFGSFEALMSAIDGRRGVKDGGAVVYAGAEIVKEDGRVSLRGEPSYVYFVKVLSDGTLDIRGSDSFDNS